MSFGLNELIFLSHAPPDLNELHRIDLNDNVQWQQYEFTHIRRGYYTGTGTSQYVTPTDTSVGYC